MSYRVGRRMTKEELEKEAELFIERNFVDFTVCEKDRFFLMRTYLAGAEPREKQIDELKAQTKVLEQNLEDTEICENGLKNRIAELEAQIENMKCCGNEIIKALKESNDYEWLHAHNGKAKYLYLQTVIDIVNEKFEEIKEK